MVGGWGGGGKNQVLVFLSEEVSGQSQVLQGLEDRI